MPLSTTYELKAGMATREAFGRTLAELGKTNPHVVVCDADLSKSTMTHFFAQAFPERFFSCGIAEANMVGIAAGLAAAGKIPFASSFSAFVVNKGFEQLRTVVAYPGLNVKVVGTHSGISIGEDGPSQMSIEDIALACSLPGFAVLSPADELSMAACIRLAADTVGPFFIRAGRPKAKIIYDSADGFAVGGSRELLAGADLTLMAHGLMVAECILAAQTLDAEGVSARVVDMYSIKPLDRDAVVRAARETGAIVVAEEHLADGGLGVRVSQVVAQESPCPMEFVGLSGYAESGTPDELLDKYGMRASNVLAAARKVLARKS
ncbi:MAG: transketolase family protein [Bryobacterales bacterium]|jgi:transketolase|nr:transketolase family protein [Bryobacterales bacterium]